MIRAIIKKSLSGEMKDNVHTVTESLWLRTNSKPLLFATISYISYFYYLSPFSFTLTRWIASTIFSLAPSERRDSIGTFSYSLPTSLASPDSFRESKNYSSVGESSSKLTRQFEISSTLVWLTRLSLILEFWEMFDIERLSSLSKETSGMIGYRKAS